MVERAHLYEPPPYILPLPVTSTPPLCLRLSAVYAIQPTSRFTVRLTAGRIIPAVATCTAAVTGLGMLELYKLIQVRGFSPRALPQ